MDHTIQIPPTRTFVYSISIHLTKIFKIPPTKTFQFNKYSIVQKTLIPTYALVSKSFLYIL